MVIVTPLDQPKSVLAFEVRSRVSDRYDMYIGSKLRYFVVQSWTGIIAGNNYTSHNSTYVGIIPGHNSTSHNYTYVGIIAGHNSTGNNSMGWNYFEKNYYTVMYCLRATRFSQGRVRG